MGTHNYFQTKEEIFLALLQREYEAWISDLEAEMAKQRTLSADALAGMLQIPCSGAGAC